MKRLSYGALVVTTVCQTIVPAALALGSPKTSMWAPSVRKECLTRSTRSAPSRALTSSITAAAQRERSALATSYIASAPFLAHFDASAAQAHSRATSRCRLPRWVEDFVKQTTVSRRRARLRIVWMDGRRLRCPSPCTCNAVYSPRNGDERRCAACAQVGEPGHNSHPVEVQNDIEATKRRRPVA